MNMGCKLSVKTCIVLFLTVYLVMTCYAAYRLYIARNSDSEPGHRRALMKEAILVPDHNRNIKLEARYQESVIFNIASLTKDVDLKDEELQRIKSSYSLPTVEIWGKASVGIYLWKHILNGDLEESGDGAWSAGLHTVENITFQFRTGPGIIQTTVPSDVKYLVLVVNGRNEEKILFAKSWLDYLPSYDQLEKVVVILLGDEKCNNDWLLPYMSSRDGMVDVVFIVYDSPLVDDTEFFQWPLGVATYRNFPKFVSSELNLNLPRPFLCNFLATVYPGSSREYLMKIMKGEGLDQMCLVKGREKWVPEETDESLEGYIRALLKSDLTLSPVGQNTECYRIFEALSLGSIPVVEDVLTPGNCDNISVTSPLRLLKQYDAPVIFIKDWSDLPSLIEKEASLSLEEKIQRRMKAVKWYEDFKTKLRKHFVNIVRETFFTGV